MIQPTIDRLEYLCLTIPPLLEQLADDVFSHKPVPYKWSKKEILGHLIDSASNNHHRFIRGQYEDNPTIWYDQDQWNALSHHQNMPKQHLITLWTLYNRHIVEILKHFPEKHLQRTCTIRGGNVYTLKYFIQDYVVHLEHHLRQMVEYE